MICQRSTARPHMAPLALLSFPRRPRRIAVNTPASGLVGRRAIGTIFNLSPQTWQITEA